jgi:hypothetical protein
MQRAKPARGSVKTDFWESVCTPSRKRGANGQSRPAKIRCPYIGAKALKSKAGESQDGPGLANLPPESRLLALQGRRVSMARTPNYGFERRERERQKAEKAAAKAAAKAEAKAAAKAERDKEAGVETKDE